MKDKDAAIVAYIVQHLKAGYKVTFEAPDIGDGLGHHMHLGVVDELYSAEEVIKTTIVANHHCGFDFKDASQLFSVCSVCGKSSTNPNFQFKEGQK